MQAVNRFATPSTSVLLITALTWTKDVVNGTSDQTNQTTRHYCLPDNATCWPAVSIWENELGSQLSALARLHKLYDDTKASFGLTSMGYEKDCESVSEEFPGAAYKLQDESEGRCMQYHSCARKACDPNGDWNIPQYSVEVKVQADIIAALAFANKYNIQVAIKTSGHNYAGSSTMDGALLIWMRHYEKYNEITQNTTICAGDDGGNESDNNGSTLSNGTYAATIKVGGGQNWEEAYRAVGNDYHLIGGGGLTVGAAGGWLMGGGLSASARKFGMGVDQVVKFEIVTADGTVLNASACENEDLFWALRGGGGGSFGVVTAVWYKLHEKQPFCEMFFHISDFVAPVYDTKTINEWISLLVDEISGLDRRWGGYWSFSSGIFYFQGTYEELIASDFLTKIVATFNYDENAGDKGNVIKFDKFACAESYFAARGGPDNLGTDQTSQKHLNIASRLIPASEVATEAGRDKLKGTFKWMVSNGFFTFNYIIGGAMSDVDADATSVHPVMRSSVFQMETFDDRLIEKLREVYPESAVGFNHAARNEPDWENQAWGRHLPRLLELKDKYDPTYRFNCYHCLRHRSLPPVQYPTVDLPVTNGSISNNSNETKEEREDEEVEQNATTNETTRNETTTEEETTLGEGEQQTEGGLSGNVLDLLGNSTSSASAPFSSSSSFFLMTLSSAIIIALASISA